MKTVSLELAKQLKEVGHIKDKYLTKNRGSE